MQYVQPVHHIENLPCKITGLKETIWQLLFIKNEIILIDSDILHVFLKYLLENLLFTLNDLTLLSATFHWLNWKGWNVEVCFIR